jgi:GT2 family glycosyltransferase
MEDKILIAIPTTGQVEIEYVNSILRLSRTTNADIVHSAGSLVYVARNEFVKKAIDEKYSHVLFIDSDMVFNADALNVLLYHDKDIVSGSIFSRVAPYKPCSYSKLRLGEGNEIIAEHVKIIEDGLQEVEGVGTAFLLIKTEVFKAVMDKYKCYPFQPILGYGEDLSFCLRARACGYKMFIDNDLTIGHIGKVVVTKSAYQLQEEMGAV